MLSLENSTKLCDAIVFMGSQHRFEKYSNFKAPQRVKSGFLTFPVPRASVGCLN